MAGFEQGTTVVKSNCAAAIDPFNKTWAYREIKDKLVEHWLRQILAEHNRGNEDDGIWLLKYEKSFIEVGMAIWRNHDLIKEIRNIQSEEL